MDEMNDSFWGAAAAVTRPVLVLQPVLQRGRYAFRTEVTNASWRDFYAGPLQDLQTVIDLNTDTPDDVSGFGSRQPDCGGETAAGLDLPDADRRLGTDPDDRGAARGGQHHAELRRPGDRAQRHPPLIDDAMTSMDDGPGPQGDQVYGGDMMMWEKFANTLKLRVAMRMSDVAPDQAKSVGEAALDGGMIIAANEENAQFPYNAA